MDDVQDKVIKIKDVELAQFFVKGDIDPVSIYRGGKKFVVEVTIKIEDVADESKPPQSS